MQLKPCEVMLYASQRVREVPARVASRHSRVRTQRSCGRTACASIKSWVPICRMHAVCRGSCM